MIRTWLAVGAVVAVGIFAAADALRGDSSPPATAPPAAETGAEAGPEPSVEGPDVPAVGALAGTLWFLSRDDCRLQGLDLATLQLGAEGPETECRLAVSAVGEFAVVPVERDDRSTGWTISLVSLGQQPVLIRELGIARGEVVWSREGFRLAWCGRDGMTVVQDVRRVVSSETPGCRPAFGADGAVLTRPDVPLTEELMRDGAVVLERDDLLRGFAASSSGRLDVLGYDENGEGLLAVAVGLFDASLGANVVLELWRGGELTRSLPLPALGGPGDFVDRVVFSPAGTEVAIGAPGLGSRIAVFDVRTGETLLPPTRQRGFSWSPDGAWFALSTGRQVLVSGAVRSAPVYVLPLAASALAWR